MKKTTVIIFLIFIFISASLSVHAGDFGDLDALYFPERETIVTDRENHVQLMMNNKGQIEVDAFWESDKSQHSFRLSSRKGREYLSLTYEVPVLNLLKVSGRAIFRYDDYDRYTIGITDRTEYTSELWLEAGYYPVLYQPMDGTTEYNFGIVQLQYSPHPFLFNLAYYSGLEPEPLRAQVGFNLTDSLLITGVAHGYLNYLDRFKAGLRFEF